MVITGRTWRSVYHVVVAGGRFYSYCHEVYSRCAGMFLLFARFAAKNPTGTVEK